MATCAQAPITGIRMGASVAWLHITTKPCLWSGTLMELSSWDDGNIYIYIMYIDIDIDIDIDILCMCIYIYIYIGIWYSHGIL